VCGIQGGLTIPEQFCAGTSEKGSNPVHVEFQLCIEFSSLQLPILAFFFFNVFFRASPAAYGGSQARGPIGALAAGLHHSHSHAGS